MDTSLVSYAYLATYVYLNSYACLVKLSSPVSHT